MKHFAVGVVAGLLVALALWWAAGARQDDRLLALVADSTAMRAAQAARDSALDRARAELAASQAEAARIAGTAEDARRRAIAEGLHREAAEADLDAARATVANARGLVDSAAALRAAFGAAEVVIDRQRRELAATRDEADGWRDAYREELAAGARFRAVTDSIRTAERTATDDRIRSLEAGIRARLARPRLFGFLPRPTCLVGADPLRLAVAGIRGDPASRALTLACGIPIL